MSVAIDHLRREAGYLPRQLKTFKDLKIYLPGGTDQYVFGDTTKSLGCEIVAGPS
jgi:hypothetical protein